MFFRPLITFALIAFLTGSATLFIVEAMSSIEGNEEFQASIEFTTVAHLFLGKRWHWAVQIVLYVALQALIITSLIESFQVGWNRFRWVLFSGLPVPFQSMDSLLISLAHKTCAISVQRGWICSEHLLTLCAYTSNYVLGSICQRRVCWPTAAVYLLIISCSALAQWYPFQYLVRSAPITNPVHSFIDSLRYDSSPEP